MQSLTGGWTKNQAIRNFGRYNNNTDTYYVFHQNGKLEEMRYFSDIGNVIEYFKWYENAYLSFQSHCKYTTLNADTSSEVTDLRTAINRCYTSDKSEITFYHNGNLATQQTLFLNALYDSLGGITEEYVSLGTPSYPDYNNGLTTTSLLHKGEFKNRMRDGEWRAFYGNDTTRLCYEVSYERGILSGPIKVYDSTGGIALLATVKYGYFDGKVTKMRFKDTVESGNYKNGLREIGAFTRKENFTKLISMIIPVKSNSITIASPITRTPIIKKPKKLIIRLTIIPISLTTPMAIKSRKRMSKTISG